MSCLAEFLPRVALPSLEGKDMSVKEYAVILDTLSAMETLLSGMVSHPRCFTTKGSHHYNEAGEYLDDLLTSIQEAKEKAVLGLKSSKPTNREEIEQRAYILVKYIAEAQELSPSELPLFSMSIFQEHQ